MEELEYLKYANSYFNNMMSEFDPNDESGLYLSDEINGVYDSLSRADLLARRRLADYEKAKNREANDDEKSEKNFDEKSSDSDEKSEESAEKKSVDSDEKSEGSAEKKSVDSDEKSEEIAKKKEQELEAEKKLEEEITELYIEQAKTAAALKFMKLCKSVRDKIDALPSEENDDVKAAVAGMLRVKLIVHDITKDQKDAETDFLTALKSNRVRLELLDNMDDEAIIDSVVDNPEFSSYKNIIYTNGKTQDDLRKAKKGQERLKDGTIQQNIKVLNVEENVLSTGARELKTHVNISVTPADRVKTQLELKSVKQIIELYQQSEEYWMGSVLSDEDERASRRAFMETYSDDLAKLYRAMNTDDKEEHKAIINALEDANALDMMKDYHNMKLARKYEKLPRYASDEQILATKDDGNLEYLFEGEGEASIKFRKEPTFNSVFESNGVAGVANVMQKKALKEFQKWIYRNCGKNGLGEAFGATGSARAYMEDFIKAPYSTQIRTLYMLENKIRKRADIPSDDELLNYVPSMKKLKRVMVSTRWKFWQRLNGKKHRWKKIKDCMDKIKTINAKKELESSTDSETTPSDYAQKISTGILVGNQIQGAGTTATNLIVGEKILTTSYIGAVGTVAGGVQSVINAANIVKQVIDNSEEMTLGDQLKSETDMIVNLGTFAANTAGTVDFVDRAIDGTLLDTTAPLSTAAKFSSAGGTIFGIIRFLRSLETAVESGIRNLYGWIKNAAKGTEDYERLYSDDDAMLNDDQRKEKEIWAKIKKHQQTITEMNKEKCISATVDCVSSGMGVVGSIAGGAFGITALSAAAVPLGIVGIFTLPAAVLIKNKYEAHGFRKVIDKQLYTTDKEKENAIAKAHQIISEKIRRFKANRGNAKLREKLNNLLSDNKKILNSIRAEKVRENGCINEKQFRNMLVGSMGANLDDMRRINIAELNPEDKDYKLQKMQKEAADILITQAGGRDIIQKEEVKTKKKETVEQKEARVKQMNERGAIRGLM